MRAYSPNGSPIVGTAETLIGTAYCFGFERDPNTGKLSWDNTGDTDVSWESQTTDKNENGEAMFYDEDGNLWAESQLVLKDEEGDE